jgi:hypothetical protein
MRARYDCDEAISFTVDQSMGGRIVVDLAEGALEREAARVLVTIGQFGGTVGELSFLSSRLRAHIANLAQFGLQETIVDELLSERNSVEVINAVVINESAQQLSEQDIVEVRSALRRIDAVVQPLAQSEAAN